MSKHLSFSELKRVGVTLVSNFQRSGKFVDCGNDLCVGVVSRDNIDREKHANIAKSNFTGGTISLLQVIMVNS